MIRSVISNFGDKSSYYVSSPFTTLYIFKSDEDPTDILYKVRYWKEIEYSNNTWSYIKNQLGRDDITCGCRVFEIFDRYNIPARFHEIEERYLLSMDHTSNLLLVCNNSIEMSMSELHKEFHNTVSDLIRDSKIKEGKINLFMCSKEQLSHELNILNPISSFN